MVEIKSEILPALEQIEQLHKVSKEEIIKLLETAITTAAKKFFGSDCKIITEIDINNVETKTYIIKKIVSEVRDDKKEISLDKAREIVPSAKIGDEIKVLVDNDVFLRIAALSAKKIIVQKIRESYKKNILEEYQSLIGEVISGSVYAIRNKTIIIDLGKVQAILPQREQVFREKFRVGQHIKVFVKDIENRKKNIVIIVSRFDKNFIKKLFESEIPEIKEKIVEIVNIVRAAGYRCKIALKSNNPKVDPVGSCVGMRGVRIKPILAELQGEKIDLIPYTEDIVKFISYSLSPWKPEKVEIVDEGKKVAKAFLPKDIFDLAIKNNININLAKELTGWEIIIAPASIRENNLAENLKNETTKK